MSDGKHTFKSSDKIRAATELPPTVITEKNEMAIDPQKLIKAWADSADVLREVVEVCEKSLAFSERATLQMERTVRLGVKASVVIFALHLVAIGTMIWGGSQQAAVCTEEEADP